MKKVKEVSIEKKYRKNLYLLECFNKTQIPLVICNTIYNLMKKRKEYIISDYNKAFKDSFKLDDNEIKGKEIKDLKNKNFKTYKLTKFNVDKNLTCFAIVDVKKVRKNKKFFEKFILYEILRNVNKILIDSKNRDSLINRISHEIEKLDFVEFFFIYLKKKEKIFINKKEKDIDKKELKERADLILKKIEKEKVLIKKSKNFLNYKYSTSFPLTYNKDLIGVISFLSNNSKILNRQNLLFLKEISNYLNLGISKFIDREEVLKKSKDQEKTIDLMLKAFSKIITMKEPYTGNHSSRVSIISYLIGKELNMNKESLKALKCASFLHDLGKLFVPSEILNKYGKLTEREFSLIKEHVLKSYEIVRDINLPEPTKKIIIQHHERLNGSGYPNGLKNDEIILEAKILAVADVIDAMLSNRPYRPPLEKEEVKEELIKNKGILYDDRIVEVALKIMDKIKYN